MSVHGSEEQKINVGAEGGAGLAKGLSIELTDSQFERLYLEPGGQQARGDLTKRFGNPTALGIGSFLLCLTPVSCYLMGWDDTSTASLPVLAGPSYFIGGLGLYLASIFEFILGNTFTFTVFATFGGFWTAFGFFLQPSQGIAQGSGGVASIAYNNGLALYLAWWTAMVFIFLVASLRTNIAFVLQFTFLLLYFILITVAYVHIGYGQTENLAMILKTAGAFGFGACSCGWWIFTSLIFSSTQFPLEMPLGDLSGFLPAKKSS